MKLFIDPILLPWKKIFSNLKIDIIDNIDNAEFVLTCYLNFEKFKNKSAIFLLFTKNDIEAYKNQKGHHYNIESIQLFNNVSFLKLGKIELQPTNSSINYKKNDKLQLGIIKGNKLYSNLLFSEIHRTNYSKIIIKILEMFLKEINKKQKSMFPEFSKKEWKLIERLLNYNLELGPDYQKISNFLRIAETSIDSIWLNYFIKGKVFEFDKNKENIRLTPHAPDILKNLAENWLELNNILGA